MKQLFIQILLAAIAILCVSCASISSKKGFGINWAKNYLNEVDAGTQKGYIPENGYVPNSETAIAIAISIWKPIYGDEHIEKQSPYFAYEVDEFWVVHSSLPNSMAGHISVGGTAKAIIEKRTGKIVHIIHHK